MTTHVMLDLETWGKTPGSDLRSIGAVVFDPVTGMVGMPCQTCRNGGTYGEPWGCTDCYNTGTDSRGEFYVATDNPLLPTVGEPICSRYSLIRDPDTVRWWSEQSPEAQAAFANPVDLREALAMFARWFADFDNGNYGSEDIRLWANDPHFDVSILAAAFRAVGLDEPWHYRAPRSQKTITEAAGMTRVDYEPFQHGTTHNALDDAKTQAAIVCEAYRRLGLRK